MNSPRPPSPCTAEACIYRIHMVAQGLIHLDRQKRACLDSRCPGELRAAIRPLAVEFSAADLRARLAITNLGDTLWLADRPGAEDYGRVRLGVKTLDPTGEVLGDFSRVALERDLAPGETAEVDVRAVLPPAAAAFLLDMVDECVTWFEPRGSTALTLAPGQVTGV